jgi:hypothetical protein
MTQVAKRLGEEWNALEFQDKLQYDLIVKADKVRHAAENATFESAMRKWEKRKRDLKPKPPVDPLAALRARKPRKPKAGASSFFLFSAEQRNAVMVGLSRSVALYYHSSA